MLSQFRYLPSPRAAVTAAFMAYGASAGLWAGAIPAVTRNAADDVRIRRPVRRKAS